MCNGLYYFIKLIFSFYFSNYKRKSDRKPCTEQMLQDARQKLEAGYSRRQIAKDLGITDTALRKRLKSVSFRL